MKVNVLGISTDNKVKATDVFDMSYEDSYEQVMFSKEVYHHEEEDLDFHYRYAIEAIVVDEYIYYSLYLVPTPDSLSKSKIKSVAEECAYDDVSGIGIRDSFDCGYHVLMGDSIQKPYDEESGIDEEIINDIASVVSAIDSLRGFYLDKPQNAIGTSGWDWLRDYLKDENAIMKTLKR